MVRIQLSPARSLRTISSEAAKPPPPFFKRLDPIYESGRAFNGIVGPWIRNVTSFSGMSFAVKWWRRSTKRRSSHAASWRRSEKLEQLHPKRKIQVR
jgi:hypothetical protein